MEELTNGKFIRQPISYPTMMRKQIKKHDLFLQPLFEAYSNALESLHGDNNAIVVKLKMAKNSLYDEKDLTFVSLEVCDTGVGFDSENFERFQNLYDESKNNNNFGTGRIQYLHFFRHTEIRSVYEENGKRWKRKMVLSKEFYDQHKAVMKVAEPENAREEMIGTSVEFYLLYDEHDQEKYSGLTLQELRDKVFLRYIGRFCLDKENLPELKFEFYINNIHDDKQDLYIRKTDVPDSDYHDSFELNYKKIKKGGDGFDELSRKEIFYVDSFLLAKKVQRKNEIKFTSKNETVDVSNIEFEAINRLSDINGKHMLCLISGEYLTNQDSDERGKIKIYTKEEYKRRRNFWDADSEQIFIDDIQEQVSKKVTAHYPKIKKANDAINNELDEMIELFSLDKEIIEKLGNVSGVSTSEFISRYTQYNAEVEAKGKEKILTEFDRLKELNPKAADFKKELKKRANNITKLIPDKNRANLAKFVAERKSVLVMLNKILHKQLEARQSTPDDKKRIETEKLIHNLLFKQKTDMPQESNLWMLNEDFIHFSGTSEAELRKVKIGNELFIRDDLTEEEEAQLTKYNKDYLGNRLDVLLFPSEHKCIIIELKSLDADVSKFTTQATRYASLIRKYAKDKFEITNFYGYLIGENFDFEAVIDADPDFIRSPHLDYVYNPDQTVNGNDRRPKGTMYIEVLKYSTLLKRANLRNKAFTERLLGKDIDEKLTLPYGSGVEDDEESILN